MLPIDLGRFLPRIESIERHPVQKGKILLYGNSFFTRWGYEAARQQLWAATEGRLDVLNHGFGGATTDELLYYYHRLVTPYEPKAVILRSVANEVRKGLSPEEAVFLLERLIRWLRQDYPDIPIINILTNDNGSEKDLRHRPNIHRANELQAQLLRQYPGTATIDINGFVYREDGEIRRELYSPDLVHFSEEGYCCLASYLGPRLAEAFPDLGMM